MKQGARTILAAVQQTTTHPLDDEAFSLDEAFLWAVIRQRFGWLIRAGWEPRSALLMASQTWFSLPHPVT